MNPLLIGILLSLAPVSELRIGIPLAISQGANIWAVLIFCTAANIIVAPLLFLFLDYLHGHLLNISVYRKTFNSFLRRIQKRKERVEKNYESWGMLALVVFTATPLPITGAWTATIIAWLLGLKRRRSLLAITAGVTIAGIVVTLATIGIIKMFI